MLHVLKKIGFVLLGAIVLILVLLITIAAYTRPYRKESLRDVPNKRVAIVLGARVIGNQRASPILADRLDGAIELYKNGKVQKILMSGDNREIDYNEVQVMRDYAVQQGIPAADITLDYAGRSTFDTCYRAKAIFGLQEAIVVTQRYHMTRAIMICRGLGMDAVGYAQPDFERYPNLRIRYSLREYLAQLKDWYMVHLSKSTSEVLGGREPEI